MLKPRSSRSAYCLVMITCPSREVALKIKDLLLENRLAACANLVAGVDSFFRWRGKLDRAEEVLLLAKTTRSRLKEIIRRVTRVHPYEVPEIIALPIVAGARRYLDWIDESLRPA